MIIFTVILLLVILKLLLKIRKVTSDKDSYKNLYDMWLDAYLCEWKKNNKLKQ